MSSPYPANFLLFNEKSSKTPIIAVSIEGIDSVFTTIPIFERITYGLPNLNYGQPGIVYGGFREVIDDSGNRVAKPYLMLDSGLTISQKIEPEQGRGSVSQVALKFIDKDGYLSQLISLNGPVPDLIGTKFVKIYFGYDGTSYPTDFFTVFRGYVSNIQWGQGYVTLTISDPNVKRRQNIFYSATTVLNGAINNSVLSLTVNSTNNFYQLPTLIDGSQDTATATLYAVIEDEIVQTDYDGFGSTTIPLLARGARGTTAASHVDESAVINTIQLEGNAIDLALKIMLSGWGGFYEEDISIRGLGVTFDPTDPTDDHAVALQPLVDAVEVYGIAVGDLIQISNATNPSNNIITTVTGFRNLESVQNNIILVAASLTAEGSPPANCAFSVQSSYDTLPAQAGLKMHPKEIDVAQFQLIREHFLNTGENTMRLYLTEPTLSKEFIESQLIFPLGGYSVTRFGKISMTLTKPPIADEKLVVLDETNIVNVDKITFVRSLTNRRFYNEIRYDYDFNDAGESLSKTSFIDADSIELYRQTSTLPISAKGVRSDLSADVLITRRGGYLLRRFKNAAYEIGVTVNLGTGIIVETGDVILLSDQGNLKILNINTGVRNLGQQLFEVIDRKINIINGNVELKLLSSIGYEIDDRFGTISPSSIIDNGATTTELPITDSYGPLFPGQEFRKWEALEGCTIHVHDYAYTQSATAIFDSFSATAPNLMNISPALPFTPPSGYIVDICDYPSLSGLASDPDELLKLLFTHFDLYVPVVSGISNTKFVLSVGNISKIAVGRPVIIRNEAWQHASDEVTVVGITGTTVEVDSTLGFTPTSGDFAEMIYFEDGKGPYRIL